MGKWKVVNWKDKVPEDKLDAFLIKIQALADAEFGVDDEGDSTVQVMALDRTRYESFHYQPMPYQHGSHTHGNPESLVPQLNVAMMNLEIASGAVRIVHQCMNHDRYIRDEDAKKKT